MDVVLVTLLGISLALVGAVLLWRRSGPPAGGTEVDTLRREIRALGDRVAADSSHIASRLEGIDTRIVSSQSANQDLAQGIFDTLGDVRRATASVADQAQQFTALQDLLKAPKARGAIGEAMLEELLRQVLPPRSYSMQHRFRTGTIVDAAVRAGGRLVCIDSKFPLANYQRMCRAEGDIAVADAERAFAGDVERHIKDISDRYIVPDEGTLDFAVMYVPAEGVYAEVLRLAHRRRPLFETAIESRVVPMSPLTMYAYLQTVLFGLKCLQIEANAEKILGFCARLERDLGRFADDYDTLGRHLLNARGRYEEGNKRLGRVRDQLERAVDLADADPPAPLEAVNDL
ncbi:MAG: DNA recombination protein RmuC [Actinomycetota bacterium]